MSSWDWQPILQPSSLRLWSTASEATLWFKDTQIDQEESKPANRYTNEDAEILGIVLLTLNSHMGYNLNARCRKVGNNRISSTYNLWDDGAQGSSVLEKWQ